MRAILSILLIFVVFPKSHCGSTGKAPIIVAQIKAHALAKPLFGGELADFGVIVWSPPMHSPKGTFFYKAKTVETSLGKVFYFEERAVICFHSLLQYGKTAYSDDEFTHFGEYLIGFAVFKRLHDGRWQLEHFNKGLQFFGDLYKMLPQPKLIQIGPNRWAVRLFIEEMHQGVGFGVACLFEVSGGKNPIQKVFSYSTYEGYAVAQTDLAYYYFEHFLYFDTKQVDARGYYRMRLVFVDENRKSKRVQSKVLSFDPRYECYPTSPFEKYFQ